MSTDPAPPPRPRFVDEPDFGPLPIPSDVLGDGSLLLSSEPLCRSQWHELTARFRVRSVVRCLCDMPTWLTREVGVDVHHVPVDDIPFVPIQEHFGGACAFIRRAHDDGNVVLVHCQSGVSRSPSIVLAYLIQRQRAPLEQAFAALRAARPVVHPNVGFMQQLAEWEEARLGRPSTFSIHDYCLGWYKYRFRSQLPEATVETLFHKSGRTLNFAVMQHLVTDHQKSLCADAPAA